MCSVGVATIWPVVFLLAVAVGKTICAASLSICSGKIRIIGSVHVTCFASPMLASALTTPAGDFVITTSTTIETVESILHWRREITVGTRDTMPQPPRDDPIDWIISHVREEIRIPTRKPNRIFRRESADGGIVPPGAVVVKAGIGIPFPSRIGVQAGEALLDLLQLPEGSVPVLTNRISTCVHSLPYGSDPVPQPRERYALVDYRALRELLNVKEMAELAHAYRGWVEDALRVDVQCRDGKWSESIAVGSESFVMLTKEK